MKPSELKKDGQFSGRINKTVKEILKDIGVSIQDIVDAHIDEYLYVDVEIKSKDEKIT